MLQADRVSFGYGRPDRRGADGEEVLREVSLTISDGGLVGILGPNGSGKSTLLRLLGGLLRPTAGRVLVDGHDMSSLSRRDVARRLAIVPQETKLAFDYTVLEVVLMGRYPHLSAFELEGEADVAAAEEALSLTGTRSLAGRVFDTLSGGEKQRVVIAGALAQQAKTMLLDEPTTALDPRYQLEIAALLRRLNAEHGVTMAVATHDLNMAASLCRELVLLREGRVLAAGPTGEVLTEASVRALYDLDAEVRYHERAGHVTVVPVGPAARRPAGNGERPPRT